MILLTSTSDKIQVITSAAAQVDVHASWIDLASGTVSAGRTNSKIATATTTDVVASPAASTTRNVKTLKVGNNHATASCTVTLQHTDGTNVIQLEQVVLAPGERLGYEEGVGIRYFDSSGREKTNSAALGLNGNQNTADLTPAAATDTYLAGSNLLIAGRIQVGTTFHWRIAVSKTAAGVAAAAFNIRFGTAGTTADTARNTLTLSAQTAVVDVGTFDIYGVFTAIGASAVFRSNLSLSHGAAVTGLVSTGTGGNYNQATVTSAAFDTTPSGLIVGLSLNTGAAAAWTIPSLRVEAANLLN